MGKQEVIRVIKHFIILSSSYSEGKRIAMHYIIDKPIIFEMINDEIKQIKQKCGETVSISTHYIETSSESWKSISTKDGFFEDVYVTRKLSEFIDLILKDRTLEGLDIAKYILSTCSCTHLKLQKLVYMCYADYLYYTKKNLFIDKIYAFKYGPVIKSVYEKYKGMKEIEDDLELNEDLLGSYERMPAKSRILFAEDGVEKIAYIDKTIKKYGSFSATELINITHVAGGPWDCVEKTTLYTEIPDSIILEKHSRKMELVR